MSSEECLGTPVDVVLWRQGAALTWQVDESLVGGQEARLGVLASFRQ